MHQVSAAASAAPATATAEQFQFSKIEKTGDTVIYALAQFDEDPKSRNPFAVKQLIFEGTTPDDIEFEEHTAGQTLTRQSASLEFTVSVVGKTSATPVQLGTGTVPHVAGGPASIAFSGNVGSIDFSHKSEFRTQLTTILTKNLYKSHQGQKVIVEATLVFKIGRKPFKSKVTNVLTIDLTRLAAK